MANETHNHVYPDPDGCNTTQPVTKPASGEENAAPTSGATGTEGSTDESA